MRLEVDSSGNLEINSGNISGSATSTGSFGRLNLSGGHFSSASLAQAISSGESLGGGGGISFDGSTANGILTYKDADEATVESNFTIDGTTISGSSTSTGSFGVVRGGNFRFTGDDDTGISLNGANQVGITLNHSNNWVFAPFKLIPVSSSPVNLKFPPLTTPNEPVEVDEPLIVVPSIVKFDSTVASSASLYVNIPLAVEPSNDIPPPPPKDSPELIACANEADEK
jgi:hypothetical protein